MPPLRIAIVAHGRFHAFDLARGLLARGHDVVVFTNYPAWAAARFGLPASAVRSFTAQGVLGRALDRLPRVAQPAKAEALLHTMFGRWAARELLRERWDVVHCWSGVSEELLRVKDRLGWTVLMRGSAHIQTQVRLLREEAERTGVAVQTPSRWMVDREEREYALADHVVVLSSFAMQSFVEQGTPRERLSVLPLGVDVSAFRPAGAVVKERRTRILSDQPLRVLYVGALSFQKGLWDLAEVANALAAEPFALTLVGPVTEEARTFIRRFGPNVTVMPKQPQASLPPVYWAADLFLFPTVQDGYAMVLAQARAAGLPIIATTNCGAAELVSEDETGWIVPIRRPDVLVGRLRWCQQHRAELARMADTASGPIGLPDWSDVAERFEQICMTKRPQRTSQLMSAHVG